ncbi:MAG: T9SS type A sorting domain-containing protein [Ignavibacteria bacterium]|nr:T9SS type A sorting domain-containing protein [Ignavibacteria bacterium]
MNLYSSGNWLNQQSNVTSKLVKCYFADSLMGWVVGDSGTILHTSNGGINWIRQNSGTGNYIFDLHFLNNSTGWCIASDIYAYPYPVLLKTTNSGTNWIKFYRPDTTYMLITVYFKSDMIGYLAGINGVMLNTTNGGIDWIIIQPDTSIFGIHPIWDISFDNTDFGYACGGIQDFAGVVWKSDPGGLEWISQGISPEPVYKIVYDDSMNAFGVGGDPEYGLITLRTTSGGSIWTSDYTNFFGIGKSFSRRVYNEIWVPLSISQAWAVSTNNGFNWVDIPTDNNAVLNDVIFTDSLHGWAVGDNGIIQKYNTEIIGIQVNQNNVISRYGLGQNYPNPFNQSTVIEFVLPEFSKVKLTVYDAIGRELKVIIDEFLPSGSNRVLFKPDDFASGIYFYKLSSKDFSETKKLVIVK